MDPEESVSNHHGNKWQVHKYFSIDPGLCLRRVIRYTRTNKQPGRLANQVLTDKSKGSDQGFQGCTPKVVSLEGFPNMALI